MSEIGNKPLIFCWKIVKYMIQPIKRIRKFRKNNTRYFKVVVAILAVISCSIIFFLYYWRRSPVPKEPVNFKFIGTSKEKIISPKSVEVMGTPMVHMPLDEIMGDKMENEEDDSLENFKRAPMISTVGCQIPVSMIPYTKDKRSKPDNCGKRAVFLRKIPGNKVQATIKENVLRSYQRKSVLYKCCYRFILKPTRYKRNQSDIQYTPCVKFKDGEIIPLKTDFINVRCSEQKNNNLHAFYDDVYAFAKMFNIPKKQRQNSCKHKYNVLLLGMDSMSLPRFSQLMTRTVTFFKENFWLGFRGFNKVGADSLPNLLATLTGQNMTFITENCARKMDNCSNLFIWNKFKEIGYVTAYGEDYLRRPDTFHGDFKFENAPTDHYMRTFFLRGEIEHSNVVCRGKIPSAQHILDYAFDFALTYRLESFFGLFWINSFSHDANSQPQDSDNMFENFFNRLTYTGVLDNTFIIFFSDHGVRFGKYRLLAQSYYDERMPCLFVWTPFTFKGNMLPLYNNLATNQFRLLTHYDLYHTLLDISSISACKLNKDNYFNKSRVLESCPRCHSLFKKVSVNRTCSDVAIHEKWCSCHQLYPLDVADTEGLKSVDAIVSHIKTMAKMVKTEPCWECLSLSLQNIIRIHFYYDNERQNLYHVVAVAMTPGNFSYEGTILRKGGTAELIGPLSLISPYKGFRQCTQLKDNDQIYCICQKISNCNSSKKT